MDRLIPRPKSLLIDWLTICENLKVDSLTRNSIPDYSTLMTHSESPLHIYIYYFLEECIIWFVFDVPWSVHLMRLSTACWTLASLVPDCSFTMICSRSLPVIPGEDLSASSNAFFNSSMASPPLSPRPTP